MTKDEAIRMAREALEEISTLYMSLPKKGCMALAAIEEVLAQPEQKPVAVYRAGQAFGEVYHVEFLKEMDADEVLLYTTPPQRTWVGLTDEEVLDMARTFGAQPWPPGSCVAFGQMVEAKLKEKNHG